MSTSFTGQLDELGALRLMKNKSMTNFIRLKYQILELLEEEELINKNELKRLRKEFSRSMEETMSALEKYCEACNDDKVIKSLQEEIEKLLSTFEEIQNQMQSYGDSQSKTDFTDKSNNSDKSDSELNEEIGQDMFKQLKRISIPTFYGDKKVYESWKAVFTACVDNSPMTAEYKLLQLRQYLGGEALKAIEQLGHSAKSYLKGI